MPAYKIELSYGGAVAKTIAPPDKPSAKRCFYHHAQRQDYGVRLYIDGVPQGYNRAIKHLGRPCNAVMFGDTHREDRNK